MHQQARGDDGHLTYPGVTPAFSPSGTGTASWFHSAERCIHHVSHKHEFDVPNWPLPCQDDVAREQRRTTRAVALECHDLA